MKTGDLVRSLCPEDLRMKNENRAGVILTWVRLGGPEGTIWEVLFPEGRKLCHEDELEVINVA